MVNFSDDINKLTEEETLVDEEISAQEEEDAAEVQSADDYDDINDSDIVFDCPFCGHTLVIDYRGAGLQVSCVRCNETVLVPIPDGMDLKDLDLEPGEILKQLFKSRRDLLNAEIKIRELSTRLEELEEKKNAAEREIASSGTEIDKTSARVFIQKAMSKQLEMAAQLKKLYEIFSDKTETESK